MSLSFQSTHSTKAAAIQLLPSPRNAWICRRFGPFCRYPAMASCALVGLGRSNYFQTRERNKGKESKSCSSMVLEGGCFLFIRETYREGGGGPLLSLLGAAKRLFLFLLHNGCRKLLVISKRSRIQSATLKGSTTNGSTSAHGLHYATPNSLGSAFSNGRSSLSGLS